MKTSKSENAEMIVLHGAMESTVSCPIDEEIGVESSGGHVQNHEACWVQSLGQILVSCPLPPPILCSF